MLEGLFQPMHLLLFVLIFIFILGIPAFIVLRLLWNAGTRLGRPPDAKK